MVGNACARASIRIIKAAITMGIPWIFVNPFSSKIWRLPKLLKFMEMPTVHSIRTGFCQWGKRWTKSAKLLAG
eukprot:10727227-Heterocapsa_arctica.AAC.1